MAARIVKHAFEIMHLLTGEVGHLAVFSTDIFVVPTQIGKPGKMGRHFPVREKSGNFKQTGKVRENHTKYWKTQEISDKYYLLFFRDTYMTCVLFAKID